MLDQAIDDPWRVVSVRGRRLIERRGNNEKANQFEIRKDNPLEAAPDRRFRGAGKRLYLDEGRCDQLPTL
jgi:hypothetical protein